MSFVSNASPNESSFPTATLSSGVQGGNDVSSSAVYSGRQRMRGDVGVDAGAVGLEVGHRGRRGRGERLLGRAAQPERAELHVVGQGGGAEQLGERAARLAAALVHLEKPVLRVEPADQEVGVMVGMSEDVRDPERVADDGRLLLEAGDVQRHGRGGRRCQRAACENGGDGEREHGEKRARCGHRSLPPCPSRFCPRSVGAQTGRGPVDPDWPPL